MDVELKKIFDALLTKMRQIKQKGEYGKKFSTILEGLGLTEEGKELARTLVENLVNPRFTIPTENCIEVKEFLWLLIDLSIGSGNDLRCGNLITF